MLFFLCKSEFPIPRKELFQFHEDPIGFQTLVGASPGVEVIQAPKSLAVGEVAILRVPLLPGLKVRWVAKHTEYIPGVLFRDEQVQGPFRTFKHQHIFREGDKEGTSVLVDAIELDFFLLPIAKWFIFPFLYFQFKARHKSTAKALQVAHKPLFIGYSRSIID